MLDTPAQILIISKIKAALTALDPDNAVVWNGPKRTKSATGSRPKVTLPANTENNDSAQDAIVVHQIWVFRLWALLSMWASHVTSSSSTSIAASSQEHNNNSCSDHDINSAHSAEAKTLYSECEQ